MAHRLRLWDLRLSRLPTVIGTCADNRPLLAGVVNTAQRRLLMAPEAGESGWYGTWAEVAFHVDKTRPYITMPREIARLEMVNVCTNPVPIYNQFFEYLRFGNGSLPKQCSDSCGNPLQVLQRNSVPTFVNMTGTSQSISVYPTNSEDVGKRVLIQGTDTSNNVIYSRDTFQRVTGIFVSLQMPFVAMPLAMNSLTGIQKDITTGPIQIFQTDPTTGVQTLLHTMEPSETVANYQRYYLNPITAACCHVEDNTNLVPITAIAKLDLVPVVSDTDYLLIQNIEAIIEECASVRYSEVDTPSAKQLAANHHRQAIGFLQGELAHYIGKEPNSINFSPFGSARLERVRIGMI